MTWHKGTSGNPNGRKPGTGKVTQLRAGIEKRLTAILDVLAANALSGDTAAAKLLLERTVPPLKSVELPAPVAMDGASLSDQGRAVAAALMAGNLAPGQAAALLQGLAALAKLIETDELEKRIAALEGKWE